MKVWIVALSLVAILGMSGFVNAAGADGTTKKKHHGGGIHGKIESVSATSFTITTGKKDSKKTMTINFDGSTAVMIDGVSGKIDSSLVGKRVSVTGAATGDTVAATKVSVSTKARTHTKKKAA